MKKDYKFPVISDKSIFKEEKTAKKRFREKLVFLCMINQYCGGKNHNNREDVAKALDFDTELSQWVKKHRLFTPGLYSMKLCPDCYSLCKEVTAHTSRCPHMAYKSFCHYCPRPCYRKERLEAVKPVMKYSGPRLILRHPILAIRHLITTIKSLQFLKSYQKG